MAAVEAAAAGVEAQADALHTAEPAEAEAKAEDRVVEEQVEEQAEVLLQTTATKQLSRSQTDQIRKQVHQEAVSNGVAHIL